MMEDPQDWRPTEVGSSESGSASCRVICNGASGVAVSKVKGLRIDPEAVVRSQRAGKHCSTRVEDAFF